MQLIRNLVLCTTFVVSSTSSWANPSPVTSKSPAKETPPKQEAYSAIEDNEVPTKPEPAIKPESITVTSNPHEAAKTASP